MDLLCHADLAEEILKYLDLSSVDVLFSSCQNIKRWLVYVVVRLRTTSFACYPCDFMEQWTTIRHEDFGRKVNIRYNLRWDGYVVRNLPLRRFTLHTEIAHSTNARIFFEPFRCIGDMNRDDSSSASSDDRMSHYWVSYDTSRRFALMFHGFVVARPRIRRNTANFKIFTTDGVHRMVHATFL